MKRRGGIIMIGLFSFTVLLNVIAWLSTPFCDFYVLYIHPIMINTFARAASIIPFSIGEGMIIIGLGLLIFSFLFGLVMAILFLFCRKRCIWTPIKKISGVYYYCFSWMVTVILLVMTLNSFIPFHCSAMDKKYDLIAGLSEENDMLERLVSEDYTIEDLIRIRNFVVVKANYLAELVERDTDGNILFPENMDQLAADSMRGIAKGCPQLAGYYPRPKQIAMSGFLSQQHMKGYFFPFSMEANYNALMHEINRPATICHEYAHLKGFMFEDEANLIAFLACINSPELTFQYSGYLSILNYINNEFYEAVGKNTIIYNANAKISTLVKKENVFLEKETWEKVEATALINTEVVDRVSDKFTETTLTINGVSDGMLSYNRVVGLLVRYYSSSKEVEDILLDQEYLAQSQ